MGLGTQIRLSRLFSHPSGRLFGIAVDHFIGYGDVRAGGLRNLPQALDRVMSAQPDSVTMLPGAAKQLWGKFAGQSSLIIQAGMFTADDRVRELIATPEEAARLGADALAVAIGVRGPYEGNYLRWLSDSVAAAAKVEMPVVAHIYPRDYSGEVPVIRFVPDEIAWAFRKLLEQRAAAQRVHRRYPVLSQHRIDPELADPWTPEIMLVEQELTVTQRTRLRTLLDGRVVGQAEGGHADSSRTPAVREVGPKGAVRAVLRAVLRWVEPFPRTGGALRAHSEVNAPSAGLR